LLLNSELEKAANPETEAAIIATYDLSQVKYFGKRQSPACRF
jgi:hypothetical protein